MAPLASGVIQTRMLGLSFGQSAPHDEFPEGGLRISGTLPYGAAASAFVNDTVLYGAANAAGLASIAVNPTGAVVTATTEALVASTSPLAVFAQYFRRFRFRKLAIEMTSGISPGVTTAAAGAGLEIQVAFEPDIVTAEQASGTYTMDTALQSRNCTRFAAWTPSISCPCIDQKSQTRSDELFFTSGAGDSQAAAGDAALRQTMQGAVTVTASQLNPTADLVVGKVLVHFVVDLYGFTNLTTGVLPSSKRRRSASYSEPGFVSLSPKSNNSIERIDSKSSSRPQSLKGTR